MRQRACVRLLNRANVVRDLLELQPCTQHMMIDEIEAATDDVSVAVEFAAVAMA